MCPYMSRLSRALSGLGILLVVTVLALFALRPDPPLPVYNEIHAHADIVVWVNGSQVDLSLPQFQSTDTVLRHRFLHVHDNDGTVLHIHARNQKLVDFFSSIGMTLTDSCIGIHAGDTHCEDSEHSLSVYTRDDGEEHWRSIRRVTRYVPRDLQQIVIRFGRDDDAADVSAALSAVTDNACYHSGLCPERGVPPGGGETCGTGGDCSALEVVPLRHHGGSDS